LQISNRGHVAEAGNDPASLELAGFAYILTTGNVQNGLWEPRGAEWLQGTELRRVVTVPYEADLLAALFEMSAQETLRLRLRSGEIVAYRLAEVTRVSQTEIDILAAPYPSLAIILYGEEDTDARWVVIGEAIQSQSDFDTYSAGNTAAPSTSNLITAEGQEIVTDDLTLSVANCQPTDQVEGQSPPGRHQRFIICDITFEGTAVPAQEEIAIAITEWSWVQSAPDWLPYQPIDIALSDLNPGQSTTISFSGIVNKVPADRASDSRPVLLWQRANATYLIELEISDTGE
jgi:hypothetical protein